MKDEHKDLYDKYNTRDLCDELTSLYKSLERASCRQKHNEFEINQKILEVKKEIKRRKFMRKILKMLDESEV